MNVHIYARGIWDYAAAIVDVSHHHPFPMGSMRMVSFAYEGVAKRLPDAVSDWSSCTMLKCRGEGENSESVTAALCLSLISISIVVCSWHIIVDPFTRLYWEDDRSPPLVRWQ